MDEAGTQPAENACVSQNGFVVLAKIEKPYTCGSVFRQPWFLIPLFALAGCFLTLCHRFSLDSFAKWACRRSCFLQHAPFIIYSRNFFAGHEFPRRRNQMLWARGTQRPNSCARPKASAKGGILRRGQRKENRAGEDGEAGGRGCRACCRKQLLRHALFANKSRKKQWHSVKKQPAKAKRGIRNQGCRKTDPHVYGFSIFARTTKPF